MENTDLKITERALRYYNNLKLCQKRYSETIEGRDKLRAANKRYYDKKKQDPEWVKKIAQEKLAMYHKKKNKNKEIIVEL